MRVLDVARMMEDSLPEKSSSDGIHFDRPRGTEWLSDVFQRQINFLESDLVETGQFTFGPPPMPSFFSSRPLADRLEGSRHLRSTPMERDEAESSTPQSSVVTSVPGASERSGSLDS